jgi:hypothetical protein
MRNGHSLSFREAVLSVCLLTLLFATPNAAQQTAAAQQALDFYASRRHAEAITRLRSIGDPLALRNQVRREVPTWIAGASDPDLYRPLNADGDVTLFPVSGQLNDQAEVLARAAAYLESFGSRIPALVCDERFQLRASIGDRVTVRTVKSATGFTRVDEPLSWFAVREVQEFNGRKQPVRADRFAEVLQDPPATRATRLQSMVDQAAEFTPTLADRRLSDPLFGLQVVERQRQPRFTFTLKGEEKIAGKPVRKIDFVERSPAVVQDDNGRDVLSSGSVWIAADGAIARTRIEFSAPVDRPVREMKVATTVNFAPDAKLGVWVPMSLLERQEQRFIDSVSNIETELSAAFQSCRILGR